LLTEGDEEAIAFINDFKKNLFAEEIVIFTPEGEMINLPSGATVLDFAYAIHTDLGNHCIGANVNHRLLPVDYQIKSGDQVEIITSRIQQPNEDWYKYVVTARAKSRIKLAIKNERKTYRKEGEEKLANYFKQLKLENSKPNVNKLIAANKLNGPVDLFYYLSKEQIGFKNVKEVFQSQENIMSWMRNFRFPFVRPKIPGLSKEKSSDENGETTDESSKNDSISEDFKALEYSVSKCCNPIPGDDVIGLVFPNEPIQIHKTECNTAIKLMSQFGKNIVKAKWKQKEGITFLAGLHIKAVDKVGFIKDVILSITDNFQLNIRSFNLESIEGLIDMKLTLYINNTDRLKKLIQHFKKTKGIIKVTRLDKFD
jgi:GTP pyrophosphokinase